MKRKRNGKIWITMTAWALLMTAASLLVACRGEEPAPPYFVGVKDLVVEEGGGLAYRTGVKAYDGKGREIDFRVDTSHVDLRTPGSYTAWYHATDQNGRRAREQITVTVTKKPKVSPEVLYALIDEKIAEYGMQRMSREELCVFLYSHIKSMTTFVNDSDKSDWIAEAYRALTEQEGDCFTYYAVARAFFERCGVEVLTVERSRGAREGTHFWLLVNMGGRNAPAWYHWDCCPHYKEYPFYTCLVTDEELLAYNEKVENYYLFDMEKYPRTPKTPYRFTDING